MRETEALHAEVVSLQQLYGLSAKDATHRLMLAELEKLKAEDQAHKAFISVRERIDKVVDHEIVVPIAKIDAGDFDALPGEVRVDKDA